MPPSLRVPKDDDELAVSDGQPSAQTPSAPAKHPLSVVDSEELKRKSVGLSLLSPEREGDDLRIPSGARRPAPPGLNFGGDPARARASAHLPPSRSR